MIRQLKIKFIMVCMISMLIVFVLLIAAINGTNLYNVVSRLDNTLELIANNGGTMPEFKPPDHRLSSEAKEQTSVYNGNTDRILTSDEAGCPSPAAKTPNDTAASDDESAAEPSMNPFRFGFNAETPFITRYFTVYWNVDGTIASRNLRSIASVPEETADQMAKDCYSSQGTQGWKDGYRYLNASDNEADFIVFLDAGIEILNVKRTFLISISAAMISYLGIFLLVFLLSGRAVRPFAENIEEQKHFITDASHELKTPLTVIAANTEILEMNLGNSEWTESIHRHIDRMQKLIDQMVSLTKMDEKTENQTREQFDLSDAVYDTVLSYAPLIEQKQKKLVNDIQTDLRFEGDEASIRRLTAILMDNAVKYCDLEGTIEVELYKKSGHICLLVENDYKDIDLLPLGKLFDRFFRADEARSASGSYGLGLAIAQSIAEKHGGRLHAEKSGTGKIHFSLIL